ncbi:MAG: transcriptional repressor LexA [Pseudomonadota bacterium]
MLTKKQRELLAFIETRLAADGVSPSFDEMREAVGLRSKSGVHRLVSGLEERGFLRRLPNRARALEVLRAPSETTPAGAPDRADPSPIAAMGQVVALPLYGAIAAGAPIEALSDPGANVDVPAAMIGRGRHYALTVEGDSMVEAGIHDGDTAIIRYCEAAENGEIVVALVDEDEVTLKRWRRRGEQIALEPCNQAYETRIFGPGRVKVQGRLVGLMRRY